MLDCYYISDSEITPDYPNEGKFIDSLSFDDFSSLGKLVEYGESIGVHLHFFEDFRIDSAAVGNLLAHSKTSINSISDTKAQQAHQKMIKILKSAVDKSSGVICFCD